MSNGASGAVNVITPGGTASSPGFIFVPAPLITSFSPVSAASGATVTINGSNLTGATMVSFGSMAARSFTVNSDTQITVIIDGEASGDVSVTTPGGTATKSGFVFIAPPIISSFHPTTGGSGTVVIISGTNFSGATAVSFNGTAAQSFTVDSSTQITAIVDGGGSGAVSVTTPGGTASMDGFVFIPPPVVTSFTPSLAGSGTLVTITGGNFNGATAVTFGGIPAEDIYISNDGTQILARVGSGATGAVEVTTPGGTASKTGFVYIPFPIINAFSPTSAVAGTWIVISGSNFTGTTAVSFNGTAAQSFTVDSDSQITAVVGNGASGAINVTTAGGTASLNGFIFISGYIDLVVQSASATVVSGDPSHFMVSYSIANLGTANAGASTTSVTIDGGTPVNYPCDPINAGATANAVTIGPFAAAGDTDSITIIANSSNTLIESNRANNTANITYYQNGVPVNGTKGAYITFTVPSGTVNWDFDPQHNGDYSSNKSMSVDSNTGWSISVQAEDNGSVGRHMTKYNTSTNTYDSAVCLQDPLHVIATNGPHGKDISLSGTGQTLAYCNPSDYSNTYLLNYNVEFSQHVEYCDPGLPAGYHYHVVVEFGISATGY